MRICRILRRLLHQHFVLFFADRAALVVRLQQCLPLRKLIAQRDQWINFAGDIQCRRSDFIGMRLQQLFRSISGQRYSCGLVLFFIKKAGFEKLSQVPAGFLLFSQSFLGGGILRGQIQSLFLVVLCIH
ncbi:Uncharacterised protein [Klebsiella pneumoniae]|nr:Uncharacterised protein [Klebsiella pneumoniae]SAW79045.1 Uncharacterised protein [Klebsiella pneumoniae]SAX85836.1 Uncharacterised protein [Klebsiella pneumoniae]SAX90778.1 Uncharacterised protein [Klebsiella pneumoniae]VAN88757.1 Uncharacterised protein [Klebsiella pneumoniae]